jgi:hypothetical protein
MCCPAVYVVLCRWKDFKLNFLVINFLRKGKVLILRDKYKYQKTGL